MIKKTASILIILTLLLCACSASYTATTNTNMGLITKEGISTSTLMITLTPVPTSGTEVMKSTLNPKQQSTEVFQNTQQALRAQEEEEWQQTESSRNTQVALFPNPCNDGDSNFISFSTDGLWGAAICHFYADPTLVVLDQTGKKWQFNFDDLIGYPPPSESGFFASPWFYALFWSNDGNNLFFSTMIIWDWGETECIAYPNTRGLYRLNLKSGNLTTLVHSSESSPAYQVVFSPANNYYAINQGGATIVDLATNQLSILNLSKAISFAWSPDGRYLAYSVAICSDDGFNAESSTAIIYDTKTEASQTILEVNEIPLRFENWEDESILLIDASGFNGTDYVSTVYAYDFSQETISITGTPTK